MKESLSRPVSEAANSEMDKDERRLVEIMKSAEKEEEENAQIELQNKD